MAITLLIWRIVCHPNLTFTVDVFRQNNPTLTVAVLKISLISYHVICHAPSFIFDVWDRCGASRDFIMIVRETFTFPVWHHMGQSCTNMMERPKEFLRCIPAFQRELAACSMMCSQICQTKWMDPNPTVCMRYLLKSTYNLPQTITEGTWCFFKQNAGACPEKIYFCDAGRGQGGFAFSKCLNEFGTIRAICEWKVR